jgi:hypothetical protein
MNILKVMNFVIMVLLVWVFFKNFFYTLFGPYYPSFIMKKNFTKPFQQPLLLSHNNEEI